MIDINKEIRCILKKIKGVTVTYYHPEVFNKLPVISYYELHTDNGMSWDNEEQAQKSYAAVDIWAGSGKACAVLAIEADEKMHSEGWKRDFMCDLPPEDGVCHKNMRFSKEIFF